MGVSQTVAGGLPQRSAGMIELLNISGGTKRATSINTPLLRLQSSEGKLTMPREIEPVRRSFHGRRSCAFTEVARLALSGRTPCGGEL